MIRLISLSVAVLLFLFQNSLQANRKLTDQYLTQFKDLAVEEMRATGIPASIKLAQGLLESDWGRSDLATKANNHFGIKCGRDWAGGSFMKYDDDSDESGLLIESCFRVFSHAAESYKAHSEFLTNPAKQSRYGFLFDYPSTDYVSWANGLKFAGYATDPKYPEKLIRLIEVYQLYKYDEPVLTRIHYTNDKTGVVTVVSDNKKESIEPQKTSVSDSRIKNHELKPAKNTATYKKSEYHFGSINEVKVVTAKGRETLESLAKSIEMDVYDLMEFNEMFESKDIILPAGTHVFIQKKKRVNNEGNEWHKVSEGESMFSIAQQYGIRLESLYSRNNMEPGTEPLSGERISLKKHVSKKDTPKHRQVVRKDAVFLNMGTLK